MESLVRAKRVRVSPRDAWPEQLVLRRGWSVAKARPWNATSDAASLRLIRGRSRFLQLCVAELRGLGATDVYSPPLPPDQAAVWEAAGFGSAIELALLRLDLDRDLPPAADGVTATDDIASVVDIDAAAFEPFWVLDQMGLAEAFHATSQRSVLTVGDPPVGFAIVGAGLMVGYLQRIAVHPDHQGAGIGTSLVVAAARWAKDAGSKALFLNTQVDNDRSLRLYERIGFERLERGLVLLSA